MSERHEATVRRIIEEAWNKGKLDILDGLVDKTAVSHDPFNPTAGLDTYKDMIRKYRIAFPDLQMHIDDIFSTADNVVVRWHSVGTHRGPFESLPPTGRKGTVSGIAINRFAGDRVAEMFVNWDALGLLQQLGAVTLPGKAVTTSV